MSEPNPRRPLDDNDPEGYMESDKDFVLNNIRWCVDQLENHFKDNTEEAVEARIRAHGYSKGWPKTSDGRSW